MKILGRELNILKNRRRPGEEGEEGRREDEPGGVEEDNDRYKRELLEKIFEISRVERIHSFVSQFCKQGLDLVLTRNRKQILSNALSAFTERDRENHKPETLSRIQKEFNELQNELLILEKEILKARETRDPKRGMELKKTKEKTEKKLTNKSIEFLDLLRGFEESSISNFFGTSIEEVDSILFTLGIPLSLWDIQEYLQTLDFKLERVNGEEVEESPSLAFPLQTKRRNPPIFIMRGYENRILFKVTPIPRGGEGMNINNNPNQSKPKKFDLSKEELRILPRLRINLQQAWSSSFERIPITPTIPTGNHLELRFTPKMEGEEILILSLGNQPPLFFDFESSEPTPPEEI